MPVDLDTEAEKKKNVSYWSSASKMTREALWNQGMHSMVRRRAAKGETEPYSLHPRAACDFDIGS